MSQSSDALYELVTVKSGACSLRAVACGETFHPVVGPMQEANALHVAGQRLVERARLAGENGMPFVIWDVGLGAAANAIAALDALREIDVAVELHSFDRTLAALRFALGHADALGYVAPRLAALESLLAHGRWDRESSPAQHSRVSWRIHIGDFRETMRGCRAPHAIFYDPYSPATNPEMWTLEHFSQLHAQLDAATPCLLTNYTRSTAVRVTLLLAGFFVGHGHATGEKDQTTVAANSAGLLHTLLDADWLSRVRRSTRSAPLRLTGPSHRPIAEADWETLLSHPQFAAAV